MPSFVPHCLLIPASHLHNICTCLAMMHKYLYAPGWHGKYAMHHSEEAAWKLITYLYDWSTIHFATLLRSSSWGPNPGKVETGMCFKTDFLLATVWCIRLHGYVMNYWPFRSSASIKQLVWLWDSDQMFTGSNPRRKWRDCEEKCLKLD